METMDEVRELIAKHGAEAKLFELFRQGILDGAALPEILTPADNAAHLFLGCDNWNALSYIYAEALGLNDQVEEGLVSKSMQDTIILIADNYLRAQVAAVVATRAPVGEFFCNEDEQ